MGDKYVVLGQCTVRRILSSDPGVSLGFVIRLTPTRGPREVVQSADRVVRVEIK